MDNSNGPSSVPSQKKPGVVKWALIIGIAIVSNLFLSYLVQVVYHNPDYNDFCPNNQVNKALESESECVSVGGQWNANGPQRLDNPAMPQPLGYCNPDFSCSQKFQDVLKVYNRNVFIVFVVAGVLLLLASTYLGLVEAISLGLSFAGVLALIIGSTWYWSDMNDILRVVILGLALAGLIYVAYKKFRD